MKTNPIPTAIVPSVECAKLSPSRVATEFRALLESGARFHAAGLARKRPTKILKMGYTPKHRLDLFGTRVYLSNVRQNPELRFYVAYVVPPHAERSKANIYARVFYKDLSLVWRVASHMAYHPDGALWVGKGDIKSVIKNGYEEYESIESTTDLPFEMQDALEERLQALKRVPPDGRVLAQVLRRGSADRVQGYDDFVRPRRRAAADRRNLIHGGKSIAYFERAGDPTSLRFVPGFEPDFARGVFETTRSKSRLYGGRLRRFRILSRNRKIQYVFISGPEHVWILPPQATTTELSSFCVRTIDVEADPDIFVPGWEYHYLDDEFDPPVWYSQIPKGYVGRTCPGDENKASAAPWLDELPVIRAFRRKLSKRRSR